MPSVFHAWLELDLPRHKAEFYNSWYLGQRAGLSHADTLAAMGDFSRSPAVAEAREAFLSGSTQRRSLEETIEANPGLLDPFEAASLRLGEMSGQLETVLKFLSDYFTAEFRAVQRMKRLMAQPMVTAIAAVFIVAFPVLYFGNAPVYIATVVLETAALLTGGGVLLAAVGRRYRSRREFVLGRFLRALAMGVESGLPLQQVIEFAVAAADHSDLKTHLARIPRLQRGRQPLGETFAGCGYLPFEVIAALEVADKTGNYRDSLVSLARMYDGGYASGLKV